MVTRSCSALWSNRWFRGGILEGLCKRVVNGVGYLDAAVRREAFDGRQVPVAHEYVQKVREHAYKVTDEDIKALRRRGWTEEQILELTVATALGAASSRLDRARRALDQARITKCD